MYLLIIQIGLEDLNWEQKFPTKELLISAHKNKEYPPRFILELCGKDAEKSVTITVSLTNVKRPVSYDIILYMPCESYQREAHNTSKQLYVNTFLAGELEEGQEEMHVCPVI